LPVLYLPAKARYKMGIQVEFNPDLALRKFNTQNREVEECLPENLAIDKIYPFLKKGQRNYYLKGEVPLLITEGDEKLSKPIASIIILKAEHFLRNNEIYTKGEYKVVEVFNDNKIHFNGFSKEKENETIM